MARRANPPVAPQRPSRSVTPARPPQPPNDAPVEPAPRSAPSPIDLSRALVPPAAPAGVGDGGPPHRGASRASARRSRVAALPGALLGALRNTLRTGRAAAHEERESRVERFAVLVVGMNLTEQLAPYQKRAPDGPPPPTAVWRDVTEAVRAEHLEDRQFGGERMSLEAFALARGYELRRRGDALRIGVWVNPNAKWDRWRLGGVAAERLRVHASRRPVNQARFGDLDLAAMRAVARRRAERDYEAARSRPVDAAALGVDLSLSRPAFALLALRRHPLLTPAILCDGRWTEIAGDKARSRSDEGWARQFEAVLADTPPSAMVSMVECEA